MSEIEKGAVPDTQALNNFNQGVIEQFRANAGKVDSLVSGDGEFLLLHTIGAKSGQPRLSPLEYVVCDGKMLIVGSYKGAYKHPSWVHNLRARPRARVEVGTEVYDVDTRELPEHERETAYGIVSEIAPVFAEYQASTTRAIPFFELTRT